MEESSEQFLEELGGRGRILLLGGVAVIAHGLARATRDVDIWLEPFSTIDEWSGVVIDVLASFPKAQPYDLRKKISITHAEISKVVDRDRVIRIIGLDNR